MSDKPKKPSKKKNSEIEKLASDILQNVETDTETEDLSDIPAIVEEPKTYERIPHQHEKEAPPAVPIKIEQGTSKLTAFAIVRRIEEVDHILKGFFGPNNGDYFIINDNTMTTYERRIGRKRYRGMLIEDKNGFRYNLWFDVTNLGPIY